MDHEHAEGAQMTALDTTPISLLPEIGPGFEVPERKLPGPPAGVRPEEREYAGLLLAAILRGATPEDLLDAIPLDAIAAYRGDLLERDECLAHVDLLGSVLAGLKVGRRAPDRSAPVRRRESSTPAHQGQLAVNKTEAARVIGVSVDFFDEHVAHELKCVRRGRRRLYAVKELQRWLDESAELAGRGD
jgi:hypothetical protein